MRLKKFSLILLLGFAFLFSTNGQEADAAAPERIYIDRANAILYGTFKGGATYYERSAYGTRYRGYLGYDDVTSHAFDYKYYAYTGYLYRWDLAYPGPAMVKPALEIEKFTKES
ncbi:hypothetical protein NVV31_23185 [Cytobacillus firmus]|uniref:hypothetical protein n=1 Tax=Cytobacillus firmus TaxID=1399 RepID=UPI0021CA8DBB|nr:hypothetical protein [Cytobacillus firmus]MCU1808278.1 hypothetical protein [Cytobacillus firmus]